MKLKCHSCGAGQEFAGPLGRRDDCAECGAELRCCRQCQLLDGPTGRCREPQAEVPREADRANFCDFFVPDRSPSRSANPADGARAAFDALFGKK